MKIELHADDVARELVEDDHKVHACFLNAYFEEILRTYKGGYKQYVAEMYSLLGSDALQAMSDIITRGEEK